MSEMGRELQGRRVLVVEDEYLLAEDIRHHLEDAGAEVLGPLPTVRAALDLLALDDRVDAAILDVNVAGEKVFPVADALRARGVPFVFSTGYDRWALPPAYADVPRYEKPFNMQNLNRALFG